MIPGEIEVQDGEIELNAGRPTVTVEVRNTGDRPVQVGSHYHFFETNDALKFEREAAYGMRLDIAAGTAVRRHELDWIVARRMPSPASGREGLKWVEGSTLPTRT